jgi:hypothetical protein
VLLAGTLLLCHGVFGVMHLVCDPPRCVAAEHAAEHQAAQAGAEAGEEHEHPAGHGTGAGYFAVLAGLLGLLVGLLHKGVVSRVGIGVRQPPVVRREPDVFRHARGPTLPVLQVFRL